jgi:hypothetical protein
MHINKYKNFSLGLIIADTKCYTLAQNALFHTSQIIDFDDILVFTDNPLLGESHTQIFIDKIKSIEDYNKLILNELVHHIYSDYYLIIQYDGFAISSICFDNIFFQYDYIGAVWPHFDSYTVGNGGFSWRSKKLIQAVAELSHLRSNNENEDVFICRTIRPILEKKYGILFAPEVIAKKFSSEALVSNANSFGFHGFFYLPHIYSSSLNYFFSNIPDDIFMRKVPELILGSISLSPHEKLIFDTELAKKINALNF